MSSELIVDSFIITGKRKSQALSDRHNEKRALSAHVPTARHHVGTQADMKCMYLNYELGFSEVAVKDKEEKITKELYEIGMKGPKMMEDSLVSIVLDQPSTIDPSFYKDSRIHYFWYVLRTK